MRDLVDEHYPDAERIRVVLDNLSAHAHSAAAPRIPLHPQARQLAHMVEIEIGVMVSQCLDRRIPDKATLIQEIAAWERRRNAEKAGIEWMVTVARARAKLGRAIRNLLAAPARLRLEPA